MISSNVQEIYNDVRTTLSVVCSKSHCQKQLFKNAPFFRLINWVIDPYVHTEERARTLILDHISAGIKSMQNTPPESWKSTIPKLLEKSEKP